MDDPLEMHAWWLLLVSGKRDDPSQAPSLPNAANDNLRIWSKLASSSPERMDAVEQRSN